MKILYIGSKATHEQYIRGKVPSHWLYGAAEMEHDGNEVIWEQEMNDLFHDWVLIKKHQPDCVFIPNLNIHHHILLLILAAITFYRKPIFAFLHHGPKVKKGMKSLIYRFLLLGCKHIFFLSDKTMEDIVNNSIVKKNRCSMPGWGPDMNFYRKVKTIEGTYFISTGKENRDFDTLIEVFRQTGAPLKIMTAKSHGESNYEWLKDRCKEIPNIDVVITENTGEVYPQMLQAMAQSKALVCALQKESLNYCVGLSTVADAEGLGKPLIITYNPYHTKERMDAFNVVESLDEWKKSINHTKSPVTSRYSMQFCWQNMKKAFL